MIKKPYELFGIDKINLKPLGKRIHDLEIKNFYTLNSKIPEFNNQELELLCKKIKEIKLKKGKFILSMGAHVIRDGVSCYIIDLMKKGFISHICFNGACVIHDFELALIGATTENVAKYIKAGEFGMWKETGYINDYIKEGLKKNYGFGQSIGYAIFNNNFKYKEQSILYNAYILEIPVTVHVGIGYDIIHQHPNCDGAVLGQASYKDFLIFAKAVENLEDGLYLCAGSAVMGPEIFLKALSMARNVNTQKRINHFTTAVFDIIPFEKEEFGKEPSKDDYRYYFRPWKTILVRTVSEGGKSYYIQGGHKYTFPKMHNLLT